MEEFRETNPVYVIENRHAFNKIVATMRKRQVDVLKKKGKPVPPDLVSKKPPKSLADVYNATIKLSELDSSTAVKQ